MVDADWIKIHMIIEMLSPMIHYTPPTPRKGVVIKDSTNKVWVYSKQENSGKDMDEKYKALVEVLRKKYASGWEREVKEALTQYRDAAVFVAEKTEATVMNQDEYYTFISESSNENRDGLIDKKKEATCE